MKLQILSPNINKTAPLYSTKECQQLLQIYDTYYPETGFHFPWVAYLIVKDNHVLGTCSFIQQPIANTVEIAYWTFKDYEGQGVASFGCKTLIAIATSENPEVTITAKTAPEHNASTHILQQNGFTFSKVVQDTDIEEAWLWVLAK